MGEKVKVRRQWKTNILKDSKSKEENGLKKQQTFTSKAEERQDRVGITKASYDNLEGKIDK